MRRPSRPAQADQNRQGPPRQPEQPGPGCFGKTKRADPEGAISQHGLRRHEPGRAPKDSQTVFVDPTHGEPWADDKRFRNHFWVPMLKALGIRYRRPNHIRHTYATMLLMAGDTLACAAKQMGYSVEIF